MVSAYEMKISILRVGRDGKEREGEFSSFFFIN